MRLPFIYASFSTFSSDFRAAALFPARDFINQGPALSASLCDIEHFNFFDLVVEYPFFHPIVSRFECILAELHVVSSLVVGAVMIAVFSPVEFFTDPVVGCNFRPTAPLLFISQLLYVVIF